MHVLHTTQIYKVVKKIDTIETIFKTPRTKIYTKSVFHPTLQM